MKQHNKLVDSNLRETKRHGDDEFPLEICHSRFSLSSYDCITCHWHPQIEIMFCTDGQMNFQVNEINYLLQKDEAIFINTNQLHSAQISGSTSSSWSAIIFDPKLLYGFDTSLLKEKYFTPVLSNKAIHCLLIRDSDSISLIKEIIKLDSYQANQAELLVCSKLMNLWEKIFLSLKTAPQPSRLVSKDTIRIKMILDYLNQNYSKKINLDELCGAINLCKSESCRIFKKEMKMTIIEYLLRLRLENSLIFLQSNKLSIAEISHLVGFNSPSYYCSQFKKYFDLTPHAYQAKTNKPE